MELLVELLFQKHLLMGACPGVCYLLLDDLLDQSFWDDMLESGWGSEDREVARKDKVR